MKQVRKLKLFWDFVYRVLFFLLDIIILYIFVKECGIWAAFAVILKIYPLMVLIVATILRIRGDITEKSFISMVFECFKITHLMQKTWNDSENVISSDSSKSKKSSS